MWLLLHSKAVGPTSAASWKEVPLQSGTFWAQVWQPKCVSFVYLHPCLKEGFNTVENHQLECSKRTFLLGGSILNSKKSRDFILLTQLSVLSLRRMVCIAFATRRAKESTTILGKTPISQVYHVSDVFVFDFWLNSIVYRKRVCPTFISPENDDFSLFHWQDLCCCVVLLPRHVPFWCRTSAAGPRNVLEANLAWPRF